MDEMPASPEAITLEDFVCESVDEVFDELAPLDAIRERLLDLADPRVTASVPDAVRGVLRELAGELADVDERASGRLESVADTVRDVLGKDGAGTA